MIDAKKFQEAVKLIDTREPQKEWCTNAVIVFIKVGRFKNARKLISWAETQEDLILRKQCILAYCEDRMDDLEQHKLMQPLLSVNDRAILEDVIESLEPILGLIRANNLVQTNLEATAGMLGIRAYLIFGDPAKAQILADSMYSGPAAPLLDLGEFVIDGCIKGRSSLISKLRDKYVIKKEGENKKHQITEDQINAMIIITLLSIQLDTDIDAAYKTGCLLRESVEKFNIDIKESVFLLLFQLVSINPDSSQYDFGELMNGLLPDGHMLNRLYIAASNLWNGNLESAEKILSTFNDSDNPIALQFKASLALRMGHPAEAVNILSRALQIWPSTVILKQLAQAAANSKDHELEIKTLQRLIRHFPEDLEYRVRLYSRFAIDGNYQAAAEELTELSSLDPDNSALQLSKAANLCLAGNLSGALEVYNIVCNKDSAPLVAFLGRASLLKRLERCRDALEGLLKIRGRFLDNPDFQLALVEFAYAAGKDRLGRGALQILQEMRQTGKIGDDRLQLVSIERLKEHIQNFGRIHSELNVNILKGRYPWLLTDLRLNNVSMWGWHLRTQDLFWKSEHPDNRADHSIYSTNAFHLQKIDGQRKLEGIKCPPPNNPIICDLSSLITLHQLQLLEKAIEYFGQMNCLKSYKDMVHEENTRLVLHQKSQETDALAIKDLVDSQYIHILPNKKETHVVDEHLPEGKSEHAYKLIDIINPLTRSGFLSQEQVVQSHRIACQPSDSDNEHPPLIAGDSITIAYSTLSTLVHADILQLVAKKFDVYIREDEIEEVLQTIRIVEAQRSIKAENEKLWSKLSTDDRIRFLEISKKNRSKSADVMVSPHSLDLAQEHSLPLFVDDRCCQVVIRNENPDDNFASFGTDALIDALVEAKMLNLTEVKLYQQLIKWRYRFLVCSPPLLKAMADEFKDTLPGQSLIDIAEYLQDCMRDPGLLTGLEKSEPPSSIAFQFYDRWITNIAGFLGDIWVDKSYNNNKATELTLWAVLEFFPQIPKFIDDTTRLRLTKIGPRLLVSRVVLRLMFYQNYKRANQCYRVIAEGLGISEKEYTIIVGEVLNAG